MWGIYNILDVLRNKVFMGWRWKEEKEFKR